MRETPEFAWAVGLFEGEGCISHREQSLRGKPRLLANGEVTRKREISLGSTDLDVLERFVAAVGGVGRIHGPTQKGTNKPIWRWRCAKWADLEPLLERMVPLLGQRRAAKAKELLADPPRDPSAARVTHCKQGHPMSGANLSVSAAGKRACRTCRRAQWRAWRARQSAPAV